MQAAGLLSSQVRQKAVGGDTSSARASGDFGAALTESMLGAEPAAPYKAAGGKKTTGSSDSRISFASDAEEQLSAARAATNPTLLVPLAVVSLPPAVSTAVPKAEGAVTAIGENLGSETGISGSESAVENNLRSMREVSGSALTAGTHAAAATTTVPLPPAPTALRLEDFRSSSSQVEPTTNASGGNPIPDPTLTGHAATSAPDTATRPLTAGALPSDDFKFALRQVESTAVLKKAATILPTPKSPPSANSTLAPSPVAALPAGLEDEFLSSIRTGERTATKNSTRTPVSPQPLPQGASSQIPRVDLESLSVKVTAAPLPAAAAAAATPGEAVGAVAGLNESKMVGAATQDASLGANRVSVLGVTKAVVQDSSASGESALPSDAPPRSASRATAALASGPILQRQVVDVYKATSSLIETAPPASRMAPREFSESVPTIVSESGGATSEKTLPHLIAETPVDTAPTPSATQVIATVAANPVSASAVLLVGKTIPQRATVPPESNVHSPLVVPSQRTSSPLPIKLSAAPAGASVGVVKDAIFLDGISKVPQQRAEPSSAAVILGKSDSALPTTPVTVTDHATPASTGIQDAVRPPIASAPEAAGASPQATPSVDPQLGPGAPLPPWGPNTSPAAPDKSKAVAATLGGNDIRSAASRAAQAQAQLVPESPALNKTLRAAVPEAAAGSKDSAEKKAAESSSPGTLPAHETPAQTPLMRDGAAVVVPHPTGASAPTHASSPETHEAPPASQLPDPTPATGNPQPGLRVTTDAGGDVQMHVGIRTAAFGAVEIYTSVHQNQVGLAVQGERGMAHWFSSEVQNIESGLKDHHLHLTMTQMDKGSTGLQTSTGSQEQQNPQRNFPALRGWQNHRTTEPEEVNVAEIAPARLPAWSGANQFSIHA